MFPLSIYGGHDTFMMLGVLEVPDFLDDAFRSECERHIPNTDEINPGETDNAYLFLKAIFDKNRV